MKWGKVQSMQGVLIKADEKERERMEKWFIEEERGNRGEMDGKDEEKEKEGF